MTSRPFARSRARRLAVLLGCLLPLLATAPAQADNPDPRIIDLPKNMEFATQITLLRADGGKSRTAPLKPDQPVRLRFDQTARDTPKTVPCTLNIAKKVGEIKAGEAAMVGVKCREVIYLPREQLGFKLLDGEREIGSGALRP